MAIAMDKRPSFIIKGKHMFKAFSGALSLALTLLVLRSLLPEVFDLCNQFLVTILTILNGVADQVNTTNLWQ